MAEAEKERREGWRKCIPRTDEQWAAVLAGRDERLFFGSD